MKALPRFLPLIGVLVVLFAAAVLGTALASNGAPPQVDSEPASATEQQSLLHTSAVPTEASDSTPRGSSAEAQPASPGKGSDSPEPGELPLDYQHYNPGQLDDEWDDDGWDDDGWDD